MVIIGINYINITHKLYLMDGSGNTSSILMYIFFLNFFNYIDGSISSTFFIYHYTIYYNI